MNGEEFEFAAGYEPKPKEQAHFLIISDRFKIRTVLKYSIFSIPVLFGAQDIAENDRGLPQCVAGTESAQVSFELVPNRDDVELVLQRTTNLSSWVEIARKTGAGSWGGIIRVNEVPGTMGRRRYSIAEPVGSAVAASFYRITTKLR